MAMPEICRYLDDIETVFLRNVSPPIQVAEIEGEVDVSSLACAYELVCVRYPVLKARIRSDRERFLLEVDPDHRPGIVVRDGDMETLRKLADSSWDPGNGVAELSIVRDRRFVYVALRADHAVIDGLNWTATFAELWRLYSAIVEGTEVSIQTTRSLPAAPLELFTERGWNVTAVGPPTGAGDEESGPELCDVVDERVRFGREITAALPVVARQHGTSVHGLVCGALLLAMRRQAPPASSAHYGWMSCTSLVDLRKHLSPPVGVDEAVGMLGTHVANVVVTVASDPIAIGSQVKAQLTTALQERAVRPMWELRAEGTRDQQRSADLPGLSITNLGRVPRFEQPPGMVITDWLRVFKSRDHMSHRPLFVVYTYDGHLSILGRYSASVYSPQDRQRMSKAIEIQVSALAG
ncbi:phthiocerol/phthiodiolone dimycocerosyl transferase family protein [Jiangella asiatica]|uniref:Phthiocerol/phthiodiolone dimycocerosyl transferase n=1 Tax=Jiangella asiatica TaxID=2530372 RepID=A0A4R5DAI7_9ACTN|nr:hypothetical protein [Jiangella asiatica]TDE10609.1 hypothetical protein E1269_11035 [Jiangella asiatica]